ncbi:MAG TPA: pyridoxamine 5'-phosphate oxidase family protein [Phototrophicaceae bacterium]|nr:pyridoxamine 5'-phosphate oxidase family protein [Phototrophicaceae bacterium]
MPKNYHTMPPTQLRRIDRAVSDEAWIIDLLHRAPVAVLATVFDGQPFLNSNLFVYDEAAHVIYMHTARTGRTRNNVSEAERVCLSVFEMGRLLPDKIALEFSVEYSGVNIFGRATVIEGAESQIALQLLCDKYFPHLKPNEDYRPANLLELKRTSVYRIAIDSWSGKQKKAADDFPGAFYYGEHDHAD